MNIVVLGASDKKHRYSYQAVMLLLEKGYSVLPVHKRIKSIEGLHVYSDINEIKQDVDTITLYVNSSLSSLMLDDICSLHPRRIIFNPGAENQELLIAAQKKGIEVIEACTLEMLNTDQF